MLASFAFAFALTVTSISATAGETVRYVHTDHLGTPIVWTDQNGDVIKTAEYEPYGLQVSGPVEDGPGYTGHVEDAATGLTYMQQRYYDPGIGMFLSVDPVTAYSNPVGQFNRYRYANGNPFRFYDPTGLLGEVLNPDQKGPNMVLVNDGQGNQMYVSASVASDTLLATSLGTTTGDLNTVTQKEKAAVTIVLGTASIVGSEIAGAALIGMAADELSDKVEAGTATAADALGVLPLGKMAKIAGASSTESKLLEAAQVLDTVNDSTEQSSKSTENDIAEVIEQ